MGNRISCGLSPRRKSYLPAFSRCVHIFGFKPAYLTCPWCAQPAPSHLFHARRPFCCVNRVSRRRRATCLQQPQQFLCSTNENNSGPARGNHVKEVRRREGGETETEGGNAHRALHHSPVCGDRLPWQHNPHRRPSGFFVKEHDA